MGLRVLVVDDDPAFLALAARLLAELGFEHVATTPDAATALATAEAERPSAALVDVGLPDRNGIELARQLAALPWSPRVVLTSTDADAVSAASAASAVALGNGAGVLPFLPKEELADGRLLGLLRD
jgi:two-component system nitrate/nitrite response regulator NarL